LKSAFSLGGLLQPQQRPACAVSLPAELTLRESFAFSLEELFLIQHDSGLLLAHHRASQEDSSDSDLISGMLTAIRDFARDSLGDGDDSQELREIEFGDERIIIQSGQYVYAAAVIKGIESTGFHAACRSWCLSCTSSTSRSCATIAAIRTRCPTWLRSCKHLPRAPSRPKRPFPRK
jgi:hypothetical protein